MKAIAAFFDIVPGWVYALLLALALLTVGAERMQVLSAKADTATVKATLERERSAHALALAAATTKVLALERQLGDLKDIQEKRDAQSKQVVDGLREDLRRRSRAGGGGGLRDPNAARCDAANGAPAAAAPGGAGDAAAAGGLLSVQLENLLLRLTGEADAINVAYASCRADAMNTRAVINTQLSPPVEAGVASPGSP